MTLQQLKYIVAIERQRNFAKAAEQCGIAGFTDDEISSLFEKAHDVENIVLPPGW